MSKINEPPTLRPKFLAKVNVAVRGDIAELFSELYRMCQEDSEFRKSFLQNPMKALLIELSRDGWRSVPCEEFEPRFEALLEDKGDFKLESMRGPFDAERVLKLAEKVYKDKEFAAAFRKDPVGFVQREVALRYYEKKTCKVIVKHDSKCKTEQTVECGVEW